MTSSSDSTAATPGRARALVAVGVAAAAMVATLPGRSHGLGLITEPLLAELPIDRVGFAALNFWATLLGAVFCYPAGWLCDRIGDRITLAGILAALGATVLATTLIPAAGSPTIALPAVLAESSTGLGWTAVPIDLYLLILLTRGLGQSALSVVSIALLGKVAGRQPGLRVGLYSFLVAFGFMAAFGTIKYAVDERQAGWREIWVGIGWSLIAFGLVALLVVRLPRFTESSAAATTAIERSLTLRQALATATFWVFGLGTAFFGMVTSGLTLFNESILAERKFDRSVYLTVMTVFPLVGLAGNLVAGWLATRIRLGVLFAVGMAIQTFALALFPHVGTMPEVYAYAVALGVSGGVLTVVFFSVWGQGFGPVHLGRIQGVAQVLTVLASAAGPVALAAGQQAHGSYAPLLQQFAVVSGVFAIISLFVRLPDRSG